MSYDSIIPDKFVPSKQCVDWLLNEAQRIQGIWDAEFHDYFEHKSPLYSNYRHVQILGTFATIASETYRRAANDWLN